MTMPRHGGRWRFNLVFRSQISCRRCSDPRDPLQPFQPGDLALMTPTHRTDTHTQLFPGDPAPWFVQRCTVPKGIYSLEAFGGRFMVLCFLHSSASPAGKAALGVIQRQRMTFDDVNVSLFGVTTDPDDERLGRLVADIPGIRFFWDMDGSVSRLYGALPEGVRSQGGTPERPMWFVLDPMLRIVAALPFEEGNMREEALVAVLRGLPKIERYAVDRPVPALILSDIFEPAFCEHLVQHYRRTGSHESGVLASSGGQVQARLDPGVKRRRDCAVRDPELVRQIQLRMMRRVVPMLHHATQFTATRLERLLVACYDSKDQGRFGPHRDNTVPANAHRRFACSVSLNDDYAGGELQFPEFGQRRLRAPAGAAIVFSCSMLHQVMPVTRGARFVLLPFLFDEEGERIRQANEAAIRLGNTQAAHAAKT